jgi:dTDP-4-dehydrorhamnose reductase
MNKILITGSEGMLGKALMHSFKTDGIKAIGADIKSNKNPLDITSAGNTAGFIKNTHPDIIIHTAAYTDVDGCEKTPEKAYAINAEGTKNIAQSAKNMGCFLIYISTDYVFDGKKTGPYNEKDKPGPISVYGKSKLLGEEAIKDILDKYLIIRTSWLFGENGKNFVDTIIKQAESGKSLKVVDDQTGCPTYTQDLALAIKSLSLRGPRVKRGGRSNPKSIFNLMIANLSLGIHLGTPHRGTPSKVEGPPATLNITNSGSCSWYEFAKEILKLKGIKGIDITPVSSSEMPRPAQRPKMSVLDNSEYIKLFGKPLPSWQNALERYCNRHCEERSDEAI